MINTNNERIATLEEQVKVLNERSKSIDSKLDELLHLRSKGVGVFWIMSSLVGTGIIGTIVSLLDWWRAIH